MKTEYFRRLLVHLLLISGCGGLQLREPLRNHADGWPAFGRTSTRINATSESVVPPLTLAWEHDITSGMGYGSPLVIDGVVIVTNLRGELYCLNAASGKRIGWVPLGESIHGSPVIDGNIAYIAVANSRESLIGYNLFEGKAMWKQEYGDLEVTPLLLGSRLYFGNTAGVFFCADKTTGETEWRFKLPQNTSYKGIRSSATTNDRLIYFGADDGSIYAVEAGSGSERWSFNTGAPVFAPPAFNSGVVYCGNKAGTLLALNAETGQELWRFEAGGSIYAAPSIADTLLIIGTTAGILYGVNTANGSVAWSREINGVINSSAAVSGTIAYVGTLKRELYAISTTDGSVVWKTPVKGRIKTSPAVAFGSVFVATDDKMILAFKQDRGVVEQPRTKEVER